MRCGSFLGGLFLLLFFAALRLEWAEQRRNDSLNVARWVEQGGRFEGVLLELPSGKWTLERAVWLLPTGHRPFWGEVRLGRAPGFDSGDRVLVSGRFRVAEPFRNLVTGAGLFEKFQPVVLHTQSVVVTRAPQQCRREKLWGAKFRERIDRLFQTAPGVRGLVRAVWTGDARGLPEEMKELFLEGGILQVLALSGQHVAGLVGIFLCLERITGLLLSRGGRGRAYLRRSLPLVACGLLLVTSEGSPSLQRTFVMALAIFVLRWRRLSTEPLQLLGTSIALLILIQPALSVNVSFFLSCGATALTLGMETASLRGRLLRSAFTSTAMPILVFPMSAFLFSKVALTAPVYSLLVAWVWDLFLIPIGFALVPIMACVPVSLRGRFLSPLESGWEALVQAHLGLREKLGAMYVTVVSPSWLEFACLEILLFVGILYIRKRLFARDPLT